MKFFRVLFSPVKWLFIGLFRLFRWIGSLFFRCKMRRIDRMDGWSFERYVAKLLRKNRYRSVRVTQGSGDFGVDIIAKKCGRVWAFQCKHYSKNLSVAPIQEIYSGAAKYKAEVAVVVTNSHFTPHARNLSESLGVLLWDRDELIELIKRKKRKKLSDEERDSLHSYIVTEVYDDKPAYEKSGTVKRKKSKK